MPRSYYGIQRVWTDGERYALIWHTGAVCVYRSEDLVAWHAPPDGVDVAGLVAWLDATWGRLQGWPDGAFDAAGVLDGAAEPPDLARWWTRALRRARVERIEDDPEGVRAAWLRMTARERAQGSERGVPAYKFASGECWEVSEGEAAAIRRALGSEHPLGRFAREGFTVEKAAG